MGVFATLTNSYAIVAIGASENFYRYATLGGGHVTVTWAGEQKKRMKEVIGYGGWVGLMMVWHGQCIRSRTARCGSHMPRDYRRDEDSGAINGWVCPPFLSHHLYRQRCVLISIPTGTGKAFSSLHPPPIKSCNICATQYRIA